MKFLLDTNICIYIIKRKPQQVLERFQTLNSFKKPPTKPSPNHPHGAHFQP